LDSLPEVTSAEEIIKLKQLAQEVHVEHSVRRYLLDIIRQTRANTEVELGASPRASLALYRAAQALALVKGRDYVIPDDVKRLAIPVTVHRLIVSTEAYLHNRSKENLIENILAQTAVPVEE
jgi:MoxR-like ATPase